MKVTQHLWFEKDMEAAIGVYTSLIPGSAIEWTTTIPAETPSGPAGSVKIASFTLGDQRYMAIEAGPLDPFNHSFSIMIECDTQPEIDRLWDALKAGGSTGTMRLAAGSLGPLLADHTQEARRADDGSGPRQGKAGDRSHAKDGEIRHRGTGGRCPGLEAV